MKTDANDILREHGADALRQKFDNAVSKSEGGAPNGKDAAPAPKGNNAESARPYPMHALGDVLGPAASAIADKVQCAEALAAQSVLAVASLAAQAVADVRLPYEQTRPLSLFVLSAAQSGDRKTSADNEAMAPVRMHERHLRESYEPLKRSYDASLAAWRAQKAQIERGKSTLDARLFELEALGPEPAPPIKPVYTVNETTSEGLAKNWPHLPGALGVFSSEGGQFFGGHGFTDEAKLRTAATLSQLWDGGVLRRLRAGDGLVDFRGRRLATHLMIQPEAALSVLADPVLRDQGLLSRILFAAPETLAGTRMWKEPAREFDAHLRRYAARLLSIFELPIAAANAAGNELTPRALDLSAEAREAWTKFHDDVEAGMATKQAFADLRDVAGKAAEQAARIAGVLTIVDDLHATTIDGNAMLRACDLVGWYLNEAVRIASDVKSAPTLQDADLLKQWIIGRGLQHVTATILQKDGPGRLRRKDKLDPAIDALEADGWLIPDGASRRAWRLATAQPQEPQKPQPQTSGD
jgi:hypothetical protein